MERRNAEVTKANIIREAEKLFFLKGFDDTHTKEIAEKAGVSEALVFKYFPNKERIYIEVFKYAVKTREEIMVKYFDAESPVEWLYQFAKDCVFPDENTPEFVKMFNQATRLLINHFVTWSHEEEGFEEILIYIIAKGQSVGEITDSETPERLAYLYWRFLIGLICCDMFFPNSNTEKDLDCLYFLFSKE